MSECVSERVSERVSKLGTVAYFIVQKKKMNNPPRTMPWIDHGIAGLDANTLVLNFCGFDLSMVDFFTKEADVENRMKRHASREKVDQYQLARSKVMLVLNQIHTAVKLTVLLANYACMFARICGGLPAVSKTMMTEWIDDVRAILADYSERVLTHCRHRRWEAEASLCQYVTGAIDCVLLRMHRTDGSIQLYNHHYHHKGRKWLVGITIHGLFMFRRACTGAVYYNGEGIRMEVTTNTWDGTVQQQLLGGSIYGPDDNHDFREFNLADLGFTAPHNLLPFKRSMKEWPAVPPSKNRGAMTFHDSTLPGAGGDGESSEDDSSANGEEDDGSAHAGEDLVEGLQQDEDSDSADDDVPPPRVVESLAATLSTQMHHQQSAVRTASRPSGTRRTTST